MEAALMAGISAILTVVEGLLPVIGTTAASTGTIASIVAMLEKWVPLIVAELPSATTLIQAVQNVIASLGTNPATSAEQLQTLQQLDAQCDTAFEAAVAADPANIPPSTN
jgi:ABC-type glycerol-3-phosphate transport system permease component